ncbi:MAG: glycosyl hydrolase family 5, partial [Candidatus Eisenbacteria bacterium]
MLVVTGATPGARETTGPRALATIDATPAAAVHRFVPAEALGAALDGHDAGSTTRNLTDANVRAIREAGLGALTYRLRTELAGEAWHWNPEGRWSDPAHARGYWTSSDASAAPITMSWGYRLPRRGNTFDQANRDGWSRLDDGDTTSFWKSDPYLDPRYTGEAEREHPPWVVADLGRSRLLDAARIIWAEPYATRYRLQWWEGPDDGPDMLEPEGHWSDFPARPVWAGVAGAQTLRLADRPVRTRWVRLLVESASHTAPTGATDPRDSLGVAIREIALGTLDGDGRLADQVRHARDPRHQTWMRVSSTDPWHRAADRDSDVEQPGVDAVCASPLADGQPVLMPVGVLYDIPPNAVALVRHLRARGVALERIELGEEPDGQEVAPEDFAALYVQTA